jgi:hypothetical protein
MKNFAYTRQQKADKETKYIVTDNKNADTVIKLQNEFPSLRAVSYDYILGRKHKPVDGVIATCKVAVEICIGLIGIMALFMGFMGIAEKAGVFVFYQESWDRFFQNYFLMCLRVIRLMVT